MEGHLHRGVGEVPTEDLEIEEDFEIVEHEQAHAVALAAVGGGVSMVEEEESSRLSQRESSVSHLEPFLDQFSGMINHTNMKAILGEQDHMLATMEIANEKLASLNSISERNYVTFSSEFRQQTQALLTMKKQLESCFRRIRFIKSKLASQYPEAYKAALIESQKSIDDNEKEER